VAELGSDIAGVFDIGPTLAVATGRQALAEAILRRLFQQRGTLINAPPYGYDLHDTVGTIVVASRVEQKVLEQVHAEEEVLKASVAAAFNQATGELVVDIKVTDAEGPFALTIKASDLRIQALRDGVLFVDEPARGETTTLFTSP
jgi:hypothetical protein